MEITGKNNSEQSSLQELILKKKKITAAVIGLGIVMIFAMIIIIYVAFKSKNFALLAVLGGCSISFLPIVASLKKVNEDIKAHSNNKATV